MSIITLEDYRGQPRNFTPHEMNVINQVCWAFSKKYRKGWPVFGTTEDGNGWCVVFDNADHNGETSCQIFIHNGLIHHIGKFGTATPSTCMETVLFETLPDVIQEAYEERLIG